ncbi:hypothetical protein BH09BAC1_BH09BAC1_11630 [soil metagenome]
MKTPLFYILLLLFVATATFAQTKEDKEKAKDLGRRAIDLVDEGKYEAGIAMLEDAHKLDPKNSTYKYEIAFALYSQKKYKEAAKLLESLLKNDDVTDYYYQLLGNTYDYLGEPEKAMDTYIAGIKKFPKSGKLYLEQGVVYISQKLYNKALEVFELGIVAEPSYPSNYYWAAKLYSGTDYPIYSALYGEIFMNLERSSKRTEEISKLLYNVYRDAIVFTDTSVVTNFVKENVISMDDLKLMKKGFMPFHIEFGMVMGIGAALDKATLQTQAFNMAYVNQVRKTFLTFWYEKGNDKQFPNPLIDYWKELDAKGHFDAYTYWIFMKGADKEGNATWVTENEQAYTAFVDYFSPNPLRLSSKNYFTSNNFEAAGAKKK